MTSSSPLDMHVHSPREAIDCGVAMIHQELNPIMDMQVFENVYVGREISRYGIVDKRSMPCLSEMTVLP